VAADTAKFGQPEILLGIIPGAGGTQRLPRLIGPARAKEIVLTGRMVDAEEARACGLINAVFPPEELLERALETARSLAAKSPLALAAAKEAVNRSLQGELTAGLDQETSDFADLFGSEDQREGMTAFVEKREPRFTGR
jgi:enoyl-CoA hydratase/carnithine racemase